MNARDVLSRVRKDTLLISIMQANNETGILQPIEEICEGLRDSSAFFHSDAAQAFGKILTPLKHPRLDLISVSGHKIFGPKGIGALIRRKRPSGWIPLSPLMYGGGQERGLRPGTLPVPLIVGLGKAAELCEIENSNRTRNTESIRIKFLTALKTTDHLINGDLSYSLSHVLNVAFAGIDSEGLMILLKDEISISNGSACTSENYKPSHVLKAMGISEVNIASSVRISWGPGVIDTNWIDYLIKTILNMQRR